MRCFFFFLLFPLLSYAHPGIGIVKDSKGNIYYTDLQQVWKISKGVKTIAVANVHTHHLHIDSADNVYGEDETYKDVGTNRYDHSLWMLHPDGTVETIVKETQAYVSSDFSLYRDGIGNEYYTKEHTREKDFNHIYIKGIDGNERIFATGDFKNVKWLHPQKDGSLLYVANNNVYRVQENGKPEAIMTNVGDKQPRFEFSGTGIHLFGAWMDDNKNIYCAVFSDQAIKKLSPDGRVTEIHNSEKHWAPTNAVYDNNGGLWVLEYSDKNEVRVIPPAGKTALHQKTPVIEKRSLLLPAVFGVTALSILFLLTRKRK